MSTVAYPHVELDPNGQAYIAGTPFKVRMLVEEHLANAADAAELQRRHPQLSLGQIYAALGYYYDHQQSIDRDIADLAEADQQLRPQLENPATTERLRHAMANHKDLG
jgi:uncharacterized protein (DUF433 family)